MEKTERKKEKVYQDTRGARWSSQRFRNALTTTEQQQKKKKKKKKKKTSLKVHWPHLYDKSSQKTKAKQTSKRTNNLITRTCQMCTVSFSIFWQTDLKQCLKQFSHKLWQTRELVWRSWELEILKSTH